MKIKKYKIDDKAIIETGDVLFGATEVLASLSKALGTHKRGLNNQIAQWFEDKNIDFDESKEAWSYNYITHEVTMIPLILPDNDLEAK